MMSNIFHYNEIARAIRLACQGATALARDVSSGREILVGSNELFEIGDEVRVQDANGEETFTVMGKTGLSILFLDREVSGEYFVSRGARIERAEDGPGHLQWVGQGSPELLPRSPAERYPCVLVKPSVMRQPLNEGSNRTVQQDYEFEVYYVERYEDGQAANVEALERAGQIFNAIMDDPYLGGTCWHSQVIEVDPEPSVQKRMREAERPLRVVRMTVLARRAALVR